MLDEETIKAIGAMLDDRLANVSTKEDTAKMVSGAFARMKNTEVPAVIETVISDRFGEFREGVSSLLDERLGAFKPDEIVGSTVDRILQELAQSEPGDGGQSDGSPPSPVDVERLIEQRLSAAQQQPNPEVEVLKKQIMHLTEANQKALEQTEQERKRAAEAQRISTAQSLLARSGAFVTGAEQDVIDKAVRLGHFKVDEETGNFVYPTKDEYGLDTSIPIDQALPKLAEMDDYKWFRAPRPGVTSGAGNLASSSSNPGGPRLSVLPSDGSVSDEDLMALYSDPAKADAVLNDVAQLVTS